MPVSVVALLRPGGEAVTARCGAAVVAAAIPTWLELAEPVAAVTRDAIAVVAGFEEIVDAVPALLAVPVGHETDPTRLDAAHLAAAVVGLEVAVVTRLQGAVAEDAVAAKEGARPSDRITELILRASEAGFFALAVCCAAVVPSRVAIVAALAILVVHDPVAAVRGALA